MADEIEFVDGFHVKAPHEKAPSFVKAQISIKVQALREWLAKRADGEEWVNIDVKEAKSGKWYAAVSTFKPKKQEAAPAKPTGGASRFDDMSDDIPFVSCDLAGDVILRKCYEGRGE
jgi:hypothetical protein